MTRFMSPSLRLGAAALLSFVVASGCMPAAEDADLVASDAVSQARPPYNLTPGKHGGTIAYATFGEPKTFNAGVAAESSSTDIINRCWAMLTTLDGRTGEDVPDLAEKWELQPDNLTYIYTLRPNLKWSDGHPLTADDVVFSFKDVAMNYPAIPNNMHDGLMVDGRYITVEKIDDRRIKFRSPKPFGPFVKAIGGIWILPKHVLGEAVRDKDSSGKLRFNSMWGVDSDVTKIVCSGPFKIAEYLPGQRTVLVRNANYWEHDKAGQQLPYVERYVWYSVKDYAAMLLKFKAGEVDVNEPMRPADYEIMKPLEKYGNFTITDGGPAARSDYLILNMTDAKDKAGKPYLDPAKTRWFRNLHFRQALQYAVDRQTMINSVYRGLAAPCLSANVANGSEFYTTDVPPHPYSLDKAKEALKAGGFTWDAQGKLHDAEGAKVAFTLTTNTGNTNRDAQCNILRTDWNRLGMTVDYKPIEFNVMVGKIDETHDFDVVLMGLNLQGSTDPHNGINSWLLDGKMHMMNKGDGTSRMPWEYEFQAIYQKAAQMTDHKARIRLYQEAMRLENTHLPYVYTVSQTYLCGLSNTIANAYPTALGNSFWNIQHQYVRTEE
jgi:peptide/nickel transport system substrate-binding protein